MRRVWFLSATILLISAMCAFAALTNDSAKVLSNLPQCLHSTAAYNPLYLMLNEMEDMLEGTTAIPNLQLTSPTVTTPTITGGSSTSPTITTPVLYRTVEVTDANDTLTLAQSGTYFIYTGGQDIFLPEATGSGAVFYIVDANATAAADLVIDPNDSCSINGDTAGQYIMCETDADGTMATLIDAAANTWYAIYTQAAWTEE